MIMDVLTYQQVGGTLIFSAITVVPYVTRANGAIDSVDISSTNFHSLGRGNIFSWSMERFRIWNLWVFDCGVPANATTEAISAHTS